MKTSISLWRVSVYEERFHTSPTWSTNVRSLNKRAAIICAMTLYQGPICRVECEAFDGYGEASPEWTGE